MSDAPLDRDVLESADGDAERRRLFGRSEKLMFSVLYAGTGVAEGSWVWRNDGGDCAVDTGAGGRLGSEGTVGSAVVSGEVVRGLLSPSRTKT